MVVPAPPRFSTTIGWPSRADNGSETTRGITSVALPAAKGMIARIGLLGHVCASASPRQKRRTRQLTSNARGIPQFLLGLCVADRRRSAAVTRRRPRLGAQQALTPRAAAALADT